MGRRSLIALTAVSLGLLAGLVLHGCGEDATINGKSLAGLSVQPATASLEVGSYQTFTAYANYTDGTTGAVRATWTVAGSIGAVTAVGMSGSFQATAEGSGTITAVYSGHSSSAAITVTVEAAPGLASIEVSPWGVTGRVNAKQTFTAAGRSTSDEAMAISPTWTLSGEAVGTLTASGATATLEMTAQGKAMVVCSSGEVQGFAHVTVEGYVVEITVECDTYVDESNPGNSYGTATSFKAGYVGSTDRHLDGYLRFPLTLVPPGASIEVAAIKVYPTSAGDASLQVKRLTGPFSDATTWESRPGVSTFLLSHNFNAGRYNELMSDQLRDLAREWLTGTATNYGVAILQEGSVNGTAVFLSLENGENFPMLIIEYTE